MLAEKTSQLHWTNLLRTSAGKHAEMCKGGQHQQPGGWDLLRGRMILFEGLQDQFQNKADSYRIANIAG